MDNKSKLPAGIVFAFLIPVVVLLATFFLPSDQQKKQYVIGFEASYNPSEPIYVIGHRNPDSDTVCSAVAYANLLNRLGLEALAVTDGKVNAETAFVLNKFGVPVPEKLDSAENKQIAIVDHGLYSQSADDMEKANIIAVIDHHGIGDIITDEPVLYLGLPFGSTSTIIYFQYLQYGVKIDKKMAGLMLSAILSDTLALKSPTTTPYDKAAAEALAARAGIKDYVEYTGEMLDAGNVYSGMTAEEILMCDYKEYSAGGKTFSIGSVQSAHADQLSDIAVQIDSYMSDNFTSLSVDMCFVMLVDLSKCETTLLCFGKDSLETAQKAFGVKSGPVVLEMTVSRKKQIVPPLMKELQADFEGKKVKVE